MSKQLKTIGKLSFILLILNSCCNNSKKTINTINHNDTINKYEFVKVLPRSREGKLRYSYELTQELTNKVELKFIENGFDSIYIRLWYIYNYGPTYQVIDFRKTEGKWFAEFCSLKHTKINDSIIIKKMDNEKKVPKSGWASFIKNILALGITNLPVDIDDPDYTPSTDGDFVVVEIATAYKYRVYSYSSPMEFPSIKETKNIEDIMELIEEEFGIERLKKI